MNKPVHLFKEALGLNNVVEPARIYHNPETGATELAKAYNIDIDTSGRISRRKGYTATSRTEASHSLFSDGRNCLFMAGTALYRLNADYSRTGLRSGMTEGQRVSYSSINDFIYYVNGFEIGYVRGDASYVWAGSSYVGPTNFKVFSNPPIGHIVAYHSSRMYIAVGSVMYYSEPFAFSWFDLSRSFVSFTGYLRMIRPVQDGIFVGTDTNVVFLGGKNPKDFEMSVVSDSPVVQWTDVDVKNVLLGLKGNPVDCAMWTAQDGIYAGLKTGEVLKLTKNKLTYPASQQGCAVFDKATNRYITLLQ